MPLLADEPWTDLFSWIEFHQPAKGIVPFTQHQPHRFEQLSIWVHDLSKGGSVAPAQPTEKEIDPLTIPCRACSSSGAQLKRQFRPLRDIELAHLRLDESTSLWPDSMFTRLPQLTGEILNNLQDAVGYLSGRAPLHEDIILKRGYLKSIVKPNKYPSFQPPVNMELGDEYRGDEIMKGQCSPSQNLRGEPQHWRAVNYLVEQQSYHMGAVIDIWSGGDEEQVIPAKTGIDVCEIQALIILLDRQTVLAPDKVKLRAWLVSMQRNRGFRVLEAWLDQSVDEYAFHFSILEERAWPDGDVESGFLKKRIDGSTDEWTWLLSWVLAQPINDGRDWRRLKGPVTVYKSSDGLVYGTKAER